MQGFGGSTYRPSYRHPGVATCSLGKPGPILASCLPGRSFSSPPPSALGTVPSRLSLGVTPSAPFYSKRVNQKGHPATCQPAGSVAHRPLQPALGGGLLMLPPYIRKTATSSRARRAPAPWAAGSPRDPRKMLPLLPPSSALLGYAFTPDTARRVPTLRAPLRDYTRIDGHNAHDGASGCQVAGKRPFWFTLLE